MPMGKKLSYRAVAGPDCVVLLTPQRSCDLDWIVDRARLLFGAQHTHGADRKPRIAQP